MQNDNRKTSETERRIKRRRRGEREGGERGGEEKEKGKEEGENSEEEEEEEEGEKEKGGTMLPGLPPTLEMHQDALCLESRVTSLI